MSWTPGPRYLLRRYCVLRLFRGKEPSRVLEVGFGTGDLLFHIAALGHRCAGVESSEQAFAEAARRLAVYGDRVQLERSLDDVQGPFDYVVSCEVLEHIEDDVGALEQWVKLLAPGGSLVLSVPSHQARWGPSDVGAGHFRRYERDQLTQLLQNAGLQVEHIWCYGWPLANMVEPVRNAVHARKLEKDTESSMAERTAVSGVGMGGLSRAAGAVLNSPLILPFCWMQMPFLEREMGNGYLALALSSPR